MAYALQTADDVRTCIGYVEALGLACSWSGLCIWIDGEPTASQRAALMVIGAEHSRKRGQWYVRAAEGIGRDLAA